MTQCDESIYRQIRRPIVYIVCGIPGSGKSYWCKQNLINDIYNNHIVYISSDEIREEICGDASDQSRNEEVFEIFYDRAREAIMAGNDVVLDATHLTKKIRRKCRNRFKDLNCKFVAVQMKTSIKKCLKRNKNRKRVVPDYAMERMIQAYEPVSEDEGFDKILRV